MKAFLVGFCLVVTVSVICLSSGVWGAVNPLAAGCPREIRECNRNVGPGPTCQIDCGTLAVEQCFDPLTNGCVACHAKQELDDQCNRSFPPCCQLQCLAHLIMS
ncbi:hypothetical protein BV898_01386 [Hypsibius exemplaris]|uniref:Uncharacterized protein n=1 Tax=Hypsibius exemplaris TaxID=2072580 RepID=A0A1W0XBI3_HYPEX|nr:hypothetical protein BV898_01386 [Hypsibius exemplaris]